MASFHLGIHTTSFHLRIHTTFKFCYLPSMKKQKEQEIISSIKKKTGNSSYQNLNEIIILLDVNNCAVNGHISRILTLILCPDFTIFPSYNSICRELLSSCLHIVLDLKLLEAMICFTCTFM